MQFGNLHTLTALVTASENETFAFDVLHPFRVDLVAVTMTLPNFVDVAIQLADDRPFSAGFEAGGSKAETHGAAHVSLGDFRHIDDHWVLGLWNKLARLSICRENANTSSVSIVLSEYGLLMMKGRGFGVFVCS